MLYSGLCSITFRQLSVDEIVELCQKAAIDGIEWGGDVHVPPGDPEFARSVREKTEAAGLTVCSYGSYFRCIEEEVPFSEVLETAAALKTSVIRVWAGNKGSAATTQADRDAVAERLRRAVVAARELDITVALEYHGGTLTDTKESAHRLLREVGLDDLKLYWQPRTAEGDLNSNFDELQAALPHLSHIHAFHWGSSGSQKRYPLAEGLADWSTYLEPLRSKDEARFVILEFVKDDEPEQFLADANTLKELIR